MSNPRRSPLRNALEYGAYLAAYRLARQLPPRSLAQLGAALGLAYFRVGRRRREVLRFNLQLAFPELAAAERERMAREVARHFGRIALDALRIQKLRREELEREVSVVGEEHLQAALGHRRGIFVLSAHVGLWEIISLVVGERIPGGLAIVHRPLDNPLLERHVARLRQGSSNTLIGKEKIGRPVIQRLRRGGAVGILIDQRALPAEGIQVPFFGHPAWTHVGLAKLMLATGAPAVPTFCVWQGPARYLVEIQPPVVPAELPLHERHPEPLTAKLVAINEAFIRRYPTQWLWYHDRWREVRSEATRSA